MRIAVVLMVCAGCSFAMQTVDPEYDGKAEPECNDSWGPMIGDGIVAGLALALGGAGAESDSAPIALGGLVVAVVFGVASFVGESNANECRDAKAAWRISGAVVRSSHEPFESDEDAADRRAAEAERRRVTARRRAEIESTPPTPRGFYCTMSTNSPTAGLCARQKPDCVRARDSLLVAVADLTDCALVETAWCVAIAAGDDRCFPAEDVCGAAVVRLGATAECREVR